NIPAWELEPGESIGRQCGSEQDATNGHQRSEQAIGKVTWPEAAFTLVVLGQERHVVQHLLEIV
ncbi:MAG: hypothetical protein DRN08_05445, partial [Thermoplasmata archaeon]